MSGGTTALVLLGALHSFIMKFGHILFIRDIKASNILLDKDLQPKISDFGLARLIPPDLTHISTLVAGTTGYLAPEYAIRNQAWDLYERGELENLVDVFLERDFNVEEAIRFCETDVNEEKMTKPGFIFDFAETKDHMKQKGKDEVEQASFSAGSGNQGDSSLSETTSSVATMTFTSIYDRSN